MTREGLRERARFLRENGDSVRAIAVKLGVPRSTVGGWTVGLADEPMYFPTCEFCGQQFIAPRPQRRFCCKAHQAAAGRWTSWVMVTHRNRCLWCDGWFSTPKRNARFCSEAHGYLFRRPSSWITVTYRKPCLFCGVMFTPGTAKARFCSFSHYQAFGRSSSWLTVTYRKPCEFCNEMFTPAHSTPWARFCSLRHYDMQRGRFQRERIAA